MGAAVEEDQERTPPEIASQIEFFERRIRPLFIDHCFECHGDLGDSIKGGLNLTSAAGWRRGGESGPVIVPGDASSSPLYRALTYHDQEFAMPPRGRLADEEIEAVRVWIEAGAIDPRDEPLADAIDASRDPWLDPRGRGREHWAYMPVGDVEVPRLAGDDWSRTPIDRFILAKLRDAGIGPVAEANPRVLARRAFFDLIGLPPRPVEMDRFLAEHRVDPDTAWTDLIERLLESPHYGERWGRHWLDVARYADSNGLDENTAFGNAWRYRDWVIRAFNQDLPYNDFVVRQIAGDLLPEPDDRAEAVDNLLATGFLALGPKVLAEPDKEKMLVDLVDEQLDVLGKAFMAQTIGCARCHDHKFDPVTHSDYYAMAGIMISTRTMETLNTVARVLERDLAPESEIASARAHVEARDSDMAALSAATAEGAAALAEVWSDRTRDALMASTRLRHTPEVIEAESCAETNLNVDHDRWGDGVGVLHTHRPSESQFVEYAIPADEGGSWRIRIRFASGETRPVRIRAAGRIVAEDVCAESTGGFDVENLTWRSFDVELPMGTRRIRFEREGAFPHFDKVSFASSRELAAREDELDEVARQYEIDVPLLRRWSAALSGESIFSSWIAYARIDPSEWETRAPIVTADLQDLFDSDSAVADGVDGRSGATPREVPFVRSMVSGSSPRSLAEVASRWQAATSLVLDTWVRHREHSEVDVEDDALPDPAQDVFRRALLDERGVLGVDADAEAHFPAALRDRIAALEVKLAESDETAPAPIAKGIAVSDGEPRDLPVFVRGDHTNKQADSVPRGFLTVLEDAVASPSIDAQASGRLALSAWITDPAHPLTARTMVNRIWAWHFGRGIVATPSNFGLRGSRPTHPELLDWMSSRFIEQGWSMKTMHRLIMNSAVYRLSGDRESLSDSIDPRNELWWRRSPRRLEAEPIRDAILAVGGNLDLRIGGSLLRSDNFGYVTNDQSKSNERYDGSRRAIYMPVIRNDMYSLFSTFDYTDPSISIESRPATVVAQQSLFMMNSPLVASQAESLAEILLAEDRSGDAQKVMKAYEICFGRLPDSTEVERAIAFVGRIEDAATTADSVSWPPGEGAAAEPSKIDARHHAWRSLCKVLIASNEFIYVR